VATAGDHFLHTRAEERLDRSIVMALAQQLNAKVDVVNTPEAMSVSLTDTAFPLGYILPDEPLQAIAGV